MWGTFIFCVLTCLSLNARRKRHHYPWPWEEISRWTSSKRKKLTFILKTVSLLFLSDLSNCISFDAAEMRHIRDAYRSNTTQPTAGFTSVDLCVKLAYTLQRWPKCRASPSKGSDLF